MSKRKVIIGSVLLILAALYMVLRTPSAAALKPGGAEPTAKVQRGPLKIVITTQGKVRAKQSEKIAHKVQGQLTIIKIVPEGKEVAKDEELIAFDSGQQKQNVEAAEAEVKNCESEVEISQRNVELVERENAEELAQAQHKYHLAQLEYEKCEKGELPQQTRKMRLELERAQSELTQAKDAFAAISDQDLQKEGFVTPAEVEKERIRLRSAEMQLEMLKTDMELFKSYTAKTTMAAKSADLETARAKMASVEGVNANKLRQKNVDLESKQTKLTQARHKLKEAQKMLEGCVLKAPTAGLVLYGEHNENYWSNSEERIRVGGQIYMNQTIITLPKLDELEIQSSVSEGEISKVKLGMQAIVTCEAYPDFKENGTVEKIGNVAQRDWSSDGAKKYEMVLALRAGNLSVKPGVSTKVELRVDELRDILKVPISAVFSSEGRSFVYLKNSAIVAREVQLGASNDTHIVIKEGLQEGEEVLLYEPENIPLPKKEELGDAKQ